MDRRLISHTHTHSDTSLITASAGQEVATLASASRFAGVACFFSSVQGCKLMHFANLPSTAYQDSSAATGFDDTQAQAHAKRVGSDGPKTPPATGAASAPQGLPPREAS